jgi:hypothetical protein
MRGEELQQESGGWHFTMRVTTDVFGKRDKAGDRWLNEIFWQAKTSYEAALAADGLALISEGEMYILDEFPPPRAHTRARSLILFGLFVLVAGLCIYKRRAAFII